MKNPQTSGKIRTSSVRAGNKSNILSPLENSEIPTRKTYEESTIVAPSDGGAFGWVIR